MSKIVEENIGIVSGMTALYCAVSDEASMTDMVTVQGWHPVSNDPTVKTVTRVLSSSIREPAWNIQNKDMWCFATAPLIMMSSSVDVQDYKYMKEDVKKLLDEYRVKVKNNPNKLKGPMTAGIRNFTDYGNTAAGYVSSDTESYYFCDSDQEFVVTNYSKKWEEDKWLQVNMDNKYNNIGASPQKMLDELSKSPYIVTIADKDDKTSWWVNEDNVLNYKLINEQLITPLKNGKKVMIGAAKFDKDPFDSEHAHTFVAVGHITDDEGTEFIQIFDPWAGKSAGQFVTIELVKLFTNFYSVIGWTIKAYMTVYLGDEKIQSDKTVDEKSDAPKPKQPFKPNGSRKLRGDGTE